MNEEKASHHNPTVNDLAGADLEKTNSADYIPAFSKQSRPKFRRLFIKFIILLAAFFYLLAIFGIPRRALTSICLFFGHDMAKENSYPSLDHPVPGRKIVIDNGSQSLQARLPLYDLLQISTTSGSIDVVIEPQPADPDHADKPARLTIESNSGSIKVIFSTTALATPIAESDPTRATSPPAKEQSDFDEIASNSLPPRPYEVWVKSGSGSVQGRFILSTTTAIYSQSGSIKVAVVPVIHSDLVNGSLITDSYSGSQRIEFTEPVFLSHHDHTQTHAETTTGHKEGLDLNSHQSDINQNQDQSNKKNAARSRHVSDSGSLELIYPMSWAGTVYAHTQGSGSVQLDGPGLQVIPGGKGHATASRQPTARESDEWWGSRGDMEVSLGTRSSGSIKFYAEG